MRNLVLLLSPILCFTAEEAWAVLTGNDEDSVLYHTAHVFPSMAEAELAGLAQKWQAIRAVRDTVNAAIEPLRADKNVGSSLQADVAIRVPAEILPFITAIGDELRFVLSATVTVDQGTKCERCWHYTNDVGSDPKHPTICGRCALNIDGVGEQRLYA